MKEKNRKDFAIKKMVLSALFLALGVVLPFLTGQIPAVGSMLLPMHIPVLLCGFLCGKWWGLAVGLLCPLLRSVLFGAPPMFPTAVAMSAELMTYGFVTGFLYGKSMPRLFEPWRVLISLLTAMILGRVVWGAVRILLTVAGAGSFTWKTFLSGAVTAAIPGIVLQVVLIPLLLAALKKAGVFPLKGE